jgi:probable phosphoglycerate mutase
MKLILVRHGQTKENVEGIFQGIKIEGVLTKKGIEQANSVGKRLKTEGIDIIYCSPMGRAKDTCSHITTYLPNTPVHYETALQEIDFGDWTGISYRTGDLSVQPDNMETYTQVQTRCMNFIEFIYPTHKDQTVLFVTHMGCIGTMFAAFYGTPAEECRQYEQHDNTAVNIIDIQQKLVCIPQLVGCAKHLETT